MNRTLLFQAGDAIGLGHLLASIALYKHLADSLGWRFCCSIRHNVLAVDPTQDVDPFFETFFALGEDRSCLSSEVFDQSLERARDNGRTVMVACRSDRLDLVSGQHDVLAGMDFQVCLLPEFRDLLSQEQLPEADVVYIDTLCPFLPFPGVEAYYAGVPAFPPPPPPRPPYASSVHRFMWAHGQHRDGQGAASSERTSAFSDWSGVK